MIDLAISRKENLHQEMNTEDYYSDIKGDPTMTVESKKLLLLMKPSFQL